MVSDTDREIEGEVTRFDAVRYLQGASGHTVGSTLFLLGGGLLWVVGYEILGGINVALAFLLSANGLSIWAWDRLRVYFEGRTVAPEETEPTRTLTLNPLSDDSLVEMKAGAVMTLTFVGFLLLGRLGLRLLGPRLAALVFVGCLGFGNLVALAHASQPNLQM
jgi:hypothetical protein